MGYMPSGFLMAELERLKGEKAADAQRPEWLRAEATALRWSGYDVAASVEKQEKLYQQLTWISTAIDAVADNCAPVAFEVKQRKGEDLTDIPNHEFEMLLDNPNPLQSRYELMRDVFAYYKLTGNAIIFQNKANEQATPDELWVIPSQWVKPVPDGQHFLKGYIFDTGNGQPIALEPWEICHVKTFNPVNPFWGLSAVQQLAMVAVGDLAQQRWNANLFDKDNAKIPGALSFASMINNPDWERLKAEVKENWGGAARKGPLMLRGVGSGGVEWLQMALSQKEMEFLDSRKFTREEVYGKLAPGLASVLDVNATEANAIAGKSVFLEFALFPLLMAVGAKMTKSILPAYGDNLVGEFEDVRQTNRLVDLEEQRQYELTHTVDEIRQEYYGDDPLGDERGLMLPAQIGEGTTMTDQETEPTPPTQFVPGAETLLPPQAIEEELKAWERYALKRLGKASRGFEPRAVPLFQAARIQAALKDSKTADEVRQAFADERMDARAVLDELRAARLALEKV
jgi:HK97 family phage portal protein